MVIVKLVAFFLYRKLLDLQTGSEWIFKTCIFESNVLVIRITPLGFLPECHIVIETLLKIYNTLDFYFVVVCVIFVLLRPYICLYEANTL
jgi:hypothetical protein